MDAPFSEVGEQMLQRSKASAYSARIQEAMRYNKLSSANYALVMTLLDAILKGYSEEQWRIEHQRMLNALTNQPPDKHAPHADAANRYEQSVRCLQDLALWPC